MADHLPDLLLLVGLPEPALARLGEIVTVHDGTGADARSAAVAAAGERIRAVLTIGTIGCTAELIASLPALEIVGCMGVGYEGVDVAAARARGIVLTHGRGTNSETVADHAVALMLAAIRGVVAGDRAVRHGEWRKPADQPPTAYGKRLGIFGLGDVGSAIARRCVGGFGMSVAYCNRRPRPDVPYPYCASIRDLAERSDILVLSAPGGPETHHLVDAEVLDALGPEGFLVNVARGGIVDSAALDVVEGEPAVPFDLLDADHLIITPHIAGSSPASREAMLALSLQNLAAHFSGQPVPTPVP